MFSLLCQLSSVFVGAVVPAFYSYKTIKRPSQKNLSYWSKYWTVFGSFLVVDVVLSTLFIHYFIPFYELGKLVFLIWAVNPQTAGAQYVFDKILAPFIHRYEKELDIHVENMINNVTTHGPSFVITAGKTLWTVAKNVNALSCSKNNAFANVYLQDEQILTNTGVNNGEDDQVEGRTIAILPGRIDLNGELSSDDEVVLPETRKQKERNKSTASQPPDVTERKCTRRAASSGRRRTAKKKQDLEEEKQKETEDQLTKENKGNIVRRPRRLAAAKRQQVIAEATESGSEG